MTSSDPTAMVGSEHTTTMRQVYEALLPRLLTLQPEELKSLNLEIPSTVSSIVGAWPRVSSFRDQIASQLPKLDLTDFDQLKNYALAMGHAHAECALADQANLGLPALNEKVTRMRDIFLSIARTLVLWGLLDAERFASIRGASGYKVVAFELTSLSSLFRQEWAVIGPRSGLQLADLEEADLLGTRMVAAVGARGDGSTTDSQAGQMRLRAFTLFKRAYKDAHRALSYVRAEQGDVDAILPPIYPGRPRRGRGSPDEPAVEPTPEPPVQGAPNGQGGHPVTPAPDSPVSPAAPTGPSTPGGPGGSPFLR